MKTFLEATFKILLVTILYSCSKETKSTNLEILQSQSWTQVPIVENGQIKYVEKITFYQDMHFQLIRKSFYTVPGNTSGYLIDTVYNQYFYDSNTSTISFNNSNDSIIVYTHPVFNVLTGKPIDTVEVIKENIAIQNISSSDLEVYGTYPDEGRKAIYLLARKLKFVPY